MRTFQQNLVRALIHVIIRFNTASINSFLPGEPARISTQRVEQLLAVAPETPRPKHILVSILFNKIIYSGCRGAILDAKLC